MQSDFFVQFNVEHEVDEPRSRAFLRELQIKGRAKIKVRLYCALLLVIRIDIWVTLFGEQHPDTLTSINDRASNIQGSRKAGRGRRARGEVTEGKEKDSWGGAS